MSKKIFKGSTMLNPVPVVLITSKNNKGAVNVFTVGWIGTACTKPPMLTVAIRPERLSYEYITETKAFVVNLPSMDLVKKVDYCGVKSGRTINKIDKMNFKLSSGKEIDVPIIDDCPVALECKLINITELGSHHLFLAQIVAVHVEDYLVDNTGKIHYENANLMCYSHGEYYPLPKKSLGKFGFSVKKRNNDFK